MIGKLDYYRIFNIVSRDIRVFPKRQGTVYDSICCQSIHFKLEYELEIQLFHRTSKGVNINK